MHKDKVVAGVGISLVLLLLIAVVGYGVWKNKQQTVTTKRTSSQSVSEDTNDSLLSINDQGGITLGSTSDGSSIGLQTNLGQKQSGAASSKTGNTSSFKEYEQYKDAKNALVGDIEIGTGVVADKGHKVALLYKGWLTNGTMVDESKPAQTGGKIVPLSFKLGSGQVIAGLEQGVFGMKKGGKRRIIIPPAVGYGDHSYGPIPANSVLIFDVELVSVE